MRWIRLAPVTAETLIICMALFIGCAFQAMADHKPFEAVQREWGAIRQCQYLEIHDGVRRVKDCELAGPFDVWDGGWWRIPLTVFHHEDLTHLMLTMGAALYLGRLLEQKWGSVPLGMFLFPAIIIPVLSELLFGNSVMGFTGAVCSMLGALGVLRVFDANLSQEFSLEIAVLGVSAIVLCSLATVAGVIPFANIAHLSGFIYGTFIAVLFGSRIAKSSLFRISVVLVHLWLIPALFLMSHPFWIGRYHWYRGASNRSPKFAEKSFERAVKCDPTLAGAWLRWSGAAEENADDLGAWTRLIRGLVFNPSNAALMDSTRRLWRHFDSRQRKEAERILEVYFGRRSTIWLNSIRASGSQPETHFFSEDTVSSENIDLSGIALDQSVEIPLLLLPPRSERQPQPIDAEQFDDAAEGRPL